MFLHLTQRSVSTWSKSQLTTSEDETTQHSANNYSLCKLGQLLHCQTRTNIDPRHLVTRFESICNKRPRAEASKATQSSLCNDVCSAASEALATSQHSCCLSSNSSSCCSCCAAADEETPASARLLRLRRRRPEPENTPDDYSKFCSYARREAIQ